MKKTKESLLKVAQRLFTKQGVAEVSLRSIAAEAGISHSNLIYHYPTKNDLIICASQRAIGKCSLHLIKK
jgi:AcrR family transcriptional regulator